jgi:hypothetical protein
MILSCHDVSTRHGLCQFNNSGTQKSILRYGIYCDFFNGATISENDVQS